MRAVGADAVVPPRPGWATRLRTLRAARRPRVHLGAGVRIGRGVRLRAQPGHVIVLGDGAAIGDEALVEALRGDVRIGPGAVVGDRASLRADGGVTVGAECVIGAWARVEGPARLGDRARLAAHAAVLGGGDVGAGAVIGSYAVVHDRVAPHAVVERGIGP